MPSAFKRKALCAVAATFAVLFAQIATAVAGERYALIVAGASGGQEYAAQYAAWTRDLAAVLGERMKIDREHLKVLSRYARLRRPRQRPPTSGSISPPSGAR